MGSPDVLVIGGGIMGCAIALRLAKEGLNVWVFDRSAPGLEASSAAAGMLAPQKEGLSPGPLLELCLRSRRIYRAFVDEVEASSGLRIDYLASGVLDCALDQDARQGLEARVQSQQAAGLRAHWLSPHEALSLEPRLSPQISGAALFPDDHQVNPRQLMQGLLVAAARAGATVRTGAVRGLLVEGQRVTGADVDGAPIHAQQVVLAAGAWSSLVSGVPMKPQAIRPVRGQMVELKGPPVLRHILSCARGYLVPQPGGGILAGSTTEPGGFHKQVTAEGLAKILNMAVDLCPSLASYEVTHSWAGLRPFVEDQLPVLGAGPLEGLLLASGHFRNGILLAPVTAQIIAELALGRPSPVDLHPFRLSRLPRS